MDENIKITYVLLSYYSDVQLLQKNINIFKNRKLIIVDNTQDISKKVKSFVTTDNNVTILEQLTNTGYAKGMNIGMKRAWEMQSKWVVLLNDDVVLTVNAIKELEKTLLSKKPGIYGPWGGFIDPVRWSTITKVKEHKPDYISGSFIIIHRLVDEYIRGFYEPYFMYYEDVDYCVRAKNAGYPVEIVNIAGINHIENSSIGKGSEKHLYYLARNHLVFLFRHAPFSIKFRELLRLPKSFWDERNSSGFRGLLHVLVHRLGQYK